MILGIMDPPAEEITDQPRRKNVQAKRDYSMGRQPAHVPHEGGIVNRKARCANPGERVVELQRQVCGRLTANQA